MLTIENIKKIEGIQIHIKGYTFIITEAKEYQQKYIFTLEYMGTVLAPFTVSLSRFNEQEFNKDLESCRYIFRKNGEYPCYVYLNKIGSRNDFIDSIAQYLNNI